ncbi:unnamed protein product [Cunninghamella blakesleeana]
MDTQQDTAFDNTHRLFIQSILSHHVLKETKAIEIYEKICSITEIEAIDFPTFIGVMDHQLHNLDYAIRQTHDQSTGTPLYIFINTKQDEMTQIATTYDANQLEYLRKLIELIVTEDDEKYSIGSLKAIKLGQQLSPPITQKASEELLEQLVEEGWLNESKGEYFMSMRIITELHHYLKEQFGDLIKECTLCSEIITMGEMCSYQSCEVRLHRHCAEQLFVTNNHSLTCPTCSSQWSRSNIFGTGLPL